MRIAYNGLGGARFELAEGAFCDDPEGCVPMARTRARRLRRHDGHAITGDDGRYAVVVDRGAPRSWVATGDGLDVETFKAFAADLVRVEG